LLVFWKQKKIPEAFSARVRTNDRDNPVVYTIKSIIHDDVDTDLILLKVDTEDYPQPYLTLADEVPDEGEEVFVISSPEGLEGVVSTGTRLSLLPFCDQIRKCANTYIRHYLGTPQRN
jgi:hypothetical protein